MPKRDYIPKGDPVWGEGPQPCRLMLIGERPGKDEDRSGRPFVGYSGKELDRYLGSIDVAREDVYVTNLVKTYAEHPPSTAEVSEWEELLVSEIAETQPDIIGAVGAHATYWFLGRNRLLEDIHGVPHIWRSGLAGLPPIHDGYQATVVPINHPASAFYDPESGKFIQYDFQMLGLALAGLLAPPVDKVPAVSYEVEKSVQLMFPPMGNVAIDTEGSRREPWCLTWSNRPGAARLLRPGPCMQQFINDLKVMFDGDEWAKVLLHNSLHDLGVLDSLGISLPDGRFIDTMVLAYLLCVEPQGLKALAYRHAGMTMMSYDDVIGGASRQVALEYLQGLRDTDWGPSDGYTKFEAGEFKIKQPWPLNQYIENILKDVEFGKNSNKRFIEPEDIDPRKRWENIDPTIRRVAEDQVGEMPEASLSDVEPKRAEDYACRDADATLRIFPVLRGRVKEMGLELACNIDHGIIPMVNRMQRVGFPVGEEGIKRFRELENKCDIIMAEKVRDIQNLTGWRINPDSPDQVRELLFENLPLMPTKFTKGGKDGNGERKASTQDKVLEELRDAHPVVPLIMDYREASKVRNSFARTIPRVLSSDGRVRCNLRITRVSSGRLSATNPNLLAIPVRSDLGKEVRACFVAPAGHVLGSWDLNQVEMRHMANESMDPQLVHIFRDTNHDVHIETTARMYSKPYDDIERLIKKEHSSLWTGRRMSAKRVGFGVITGITGMGLKDQFSLANAVSDDGDPWTVEECDELIEAWFKVYTAVPSYMEACKAETRRYGFVRDMWRRIRYLPGVHSPIPRIREEAQRQSHSHKIQAGAQGIIKVAMRRIWEELPALWDAGWYVEPILQIHDELVFELEEHPVLIDIMNEMVPRHLTTAFLEYFPDYQVPLKAAGTTASDWGQLK